MPEITGSVGEFAGALRTMFGLTRKNRVRDHIRELTDLYEKLEPHDDLGPAAKSVATSIGHLANRLERAHTPRGRRQITELNWGPCISGLFCTAIIVLPAVLLWKPLQWWTISLFVVSAVAGTLFLAVSVSTLFDRPESNT